MATYTSNYGWTKPSGSDNVDISVLNDNLDDQDSTIHDAFLNMAPPFSESSTYAVNDIVLYDTGLYKCHTAVVTPGSWTGSTNWQVYKLSEGGSGGGGTSNYNDLTDKPSINGVTLSGNKTTSDLGIDKTAVGLGNVPNVSTNDQTPTFTEASTRNNIASGEKLSVILGKVQKFFNDLKTVAFSGSYTDLSSKPSINSNELSGNKTSAQLGLQNASTEVTWAQWIQKTSQEQETGDWRITDCPWADGDVSVDLLAKLWENPSPTSSFAAGDITLSSNDYDLILVISRYSKSSNNTVPAYIGKKGYINFADWSGQSMTAMYRSVSASGTTATFSGASVNGTINNDYLIPTVIYGIKLTASVKINAIAMDVSTSADKCMLSENESVKDRIEAVTPGIGVDISSATENAPYTAPSDGYVRFNAPSTTTLRLGDNTRSVLLSYGTGNDVSIFTKKGTKIFFNATPTVGIFNPLV